MKLDTDLPRCHGIRLHSLSAILLPVEDSVTEERFLERVPAAWDETRLLRGYPGSEATFARRRDDEWFVGCITAGAPRTVTLSPDFLDDVSEGIVVRDGDSGEQLIRESVIGRPSNELSIDVPRNGGFVCYYG